jgi:hypothetical protein
MAVSCLQISLRKESKLKREMSVVYANVCIVLTILLSSKYLQDWQHSTIKIKLAGYWTRRKKQMISFGKLNGNWLCFGCCRWTWMAPTLVSKMSISVTKTIISGIFCILLTYLLTHLLAYLPTELSPSWEAANCAATQELPSNLWNPKFLYRVHKSPPLAPILNQIDLVHTIPFYLSKIYFNIVHPPTS